MLNTFKAKITNFLAQQQIVENELLKYAYSTDASLYRMVPKLILIVKNEVEIIKIIKLANQYNIKLTFRTAGTSLSGQAVTDQVLVVLAADAWLDYQIIDNGNKIKLEPSIIGAQANNYLKIYKRKIGPDPGSINSAKIGGIIANNSSGMCCGIAKNSYATLDSMRVVFADGSLLDSADTNSVETFKKNNKDFINSILDIHQQIIQNQELVDFIKKKFAIKNTSGYSLNAFLDFTDPIKIIERLIIGSEGTLGFVSNVTLNTVVDYKYKALNLIYGNLDELIILTAKLQAFAPSSVELLDYLSLKSVSGIAELQPFLIKLEDTNIAAIMIELAEDSQQSLESQLNAVNQCIDAANILHQVGFRKDEQQMQTLWKARNGVLPTIAAQRPNGSSVLIEDIAVNILDLPKLISDVKKLFVKYHYTNAAIFGHVLAGNIHFVLTPDFNVQKQLVEYDEFMHELTTLVAKKYNGSLKAEHGSGRNISTFAIVEWGEKCWDIMWQIKNLFDKQNILNPDVKLTRDTKLHIKNLKELNSVDEQIDKCMECGFCEPVCPSRNLSLTPRQRNTVARKIQTLDDQQKQQWLKDYEYYGIQTCATTSLCKMRCPVDIDTGAFILSKKAPQDRLVNHSKAINIAKQKVRLGNLTANIIGKHNLHSMTQSLHSKFKSIPVYLETMPKVQSCSFINSNVATKQKVLLIPACPNRIFAGSSKYAKYPSQLILEKLGFEVNYPTKVNSQCCGQMYHSQSNYSQQQNSQELLQRSIDPTKYSYIVTDNSSCANFVKDQNLSITNINNLIIDNLVNLKLTKKFSKIALHIDCSTRKQNIDNKYIQALHKCCDKVVIPEQIYCCGFAGDKGFTIPELNATSLAPLKPQIKDCQIGVSFNRSCQIGLSYHGQLEYISFIELLLECLK
ncbi:MULTISPECIES: FAD-binding and (Fe-S)-binding domain-containing protein [Francisella]|uniref:D-lactate dehydrogenase (cytochrome) n=1 Tax=Francisella opportunistica TaxID=2016517 RepID=A0A345JRX2_9GAMM|nr:MULTISPECIES: FAD-binding and (Fe-S)-binding domain-containing protein [Francisella]APC91822.1 Putative D-lactate dehydrogenase, Fe-S protein, FAD/FMN-containing [Francisella sp. MA067296]AXH30068.1 FAD-binding oxidoreductase [Francisella opportunistica]AXH31712.1 FAD-binding oxidoreductase [Francisella opportunistica]AXH33358.1 FAD-binding oxidoreductase [Francisella opportunistica]